MDLDYDTPGEVIDSSLPAEQRVWKASQRHRLRPHQQPSFEQRYPSNHYKNLKVHVFTNLNLDQGLKIFENVGMKATKSEMQKMINKVVSHPIKGEQLTKKQKAEN